MKTKTSELKDLALDWAVASIEDPEMAKAMAETGCIFCGYSYSLADGWAIIKREHISLSSPTEQLTMFWTANIGRERKFTQWGHDPLIAAMRCYVAYKLGEEVDIPDAFLTQ